MKNKWSLAPFHVSRWAPTRVLDVGQGSWQREGLETDGEMLYFTRLPSGGPGGGSHLN